jgi:hypothetical protein
MLQQKRMDALWRLASDYGLDDRTLVHAALGLGAALLVPGHAFGARFGRVLGERISIDASNDERLPDDRAIREGVVRVDDRHAAAIGKQMTARWNDAAGAQLITPFNAGNALYVLSFWSPQPAPRAFTSDDDGFAESIATLIGSRIQHKWDAVVRDPLEVVSLGGVAG